MIINRVAFLCPVIADELIISKISSHLTAVLQQQQPVTVSNGAGAQGAQGVQGLGTYSGDIHAAVQLLHFLVTLCPLTPALITSLHRTGTLTATLLLHCHLVHSSPLSPLSPLSPVSPLCPTAPGKTDSATAGKLGNGECVEGEGTILQQVTDILMLCLIKDVCSSAVWAIEQFLACTVRGECALMYRLKETLITSLHPTAR
jgi:hypothetical protein